MKQLEIIIAFNDDGSVRSLTKDIVGLTAKELQMLGGFFYGQVIRIGEYLPEDMTKEIPTIAEVFLSAEKGILKKK